MVFLLVWVLIFFSFFVCLVLMEFLRAVEGLFIFFFFYKSDTAT